MLNFSTKKRVIQMSISIVLLVLLISSYLCSSQGFNRVPNLQVEVPRNWTCNPSAYQDGVCDCLCGVSDPDCFQNGQYTVASNCPCKSMTCPDAYCYGICNKEDYNYSMAQLNNVTILLTLNTTLLGLALILILVLVCIRWSDEETIALSRELQIPLLEQRKIARENEALNRMIPRRESRVRKMLHKLFNRSGATDGNAALLAGKL